MIRLAHARKPNVVIHSGPDAWLILEDKNGKETARVVIDAEDLPYVRNGRWRLHSCGYAVGIRSSQEGGNRPVFLHRALTEAPVGHVVDHIDGNRLNNRRANLRLLTLEESPQNQLPASPSGHRGVYFEKQTGRWRAAVQLRRKSHKSPRFDDISDAVAWVIAKRGQVMPFCVSERHYPPPAPAVGASFRSSAISKLFSQAHKATLSELNRSPEGRVALEKPCPDVRAFRAHLRISQSEFARRYGMSRDSVLQWEAGRYQPSVPVASALRLAALKAGFSW